MGCFSANPLAFGAGADIGDIEFNPAMGVEMAIIPAAIALGVLVALFVVDKVRKSKK